MSGCGCSSPGRPSSSGDAGAPATGPVGPCTHAQSSIQIVDELGLPLANAAVQVTVGAAGASMMTDANGFLCFSAPPGTAVQLEIVDSHDFAPGHSTVTSSGHHFLTNGMGP